MVSSLGLPIIVVAVCIALGFALHSILFAVLRSLSRRSTTVVDDLLVSYGKGPLRLLLPLVLLTFVAPFVGASDALRTTFGRAVSLAFIGGFTYLAINATAFVAAYIIGHQKLTASDNLSARRIVTQVRVLKKVVFCIIAVVGLSCALMTFDGIRQVGVSILASAGLAGVVLGFAAQKSIGTLLAGVQIAITQPIRIDDVVIVEGEWGRIEEISLTYVVVEIWDLRRLIVPITYFIEKPFQNWTRVSSALLGTVFLYVDYTVPVDAIRAELLRLVETHPLWDKKVASVQMTDTKPSGVELRVLVSASDASKAWDLRCELREKLVDLIRTKYPSALPRVRAELPGSGGGAVGSPVTQRAQTTKVSVG